MTYTLSQFPMARKAIEDHESITVNVSDPSRRRGRGRDHAPRRRQVPADPADDPPGPGHRPARGARPPARAHVQPPGDAPRQRPRRAGRRGHAQRQGVRAAQAQRPGRARPAPRHRDDRGRARRPAARRAAGVLQAAADLATEALDAMSCVASCDGSSAGATGAPVRPGDRRHHADGHGPRDRLHGALRREPARADPHAEPRRRRGPGRAPRPDRRHGRRRARGSARETPSGLARARAGPCYPLCYPDAMPRGRSSQLVVLDTETTGLDPERDRIIDIGAVRSARTSKSASVSSTLVDPGVPIPLFITRLVGIADAGRRAAPPASPEAFAALREFAGDAVLVGHNAGFDRDHLAAGARRAGLPLLGNRWFDTLEAALLLYPELDRHALAILAAEFGIERQAHRALPDAETAADVLRRLCARAAGLGAEERGCSTAVRWAPLELLDRFGGARRGAPAGGRRRAARPGGAARCPARRRRRLARRAGRRRAGDRRSASRLPASRAWPRACPAFAGARARRSSPPPPPTSSRTAASASSRPAPAWARAWPTCCRRRSPAPLPDAA